MDRVVSTAKIAIPIGRRVSSEATGNGRLATIYESAGSRSLKDWRLGGHRHDASGWQGSPSAIPPPRRSIASVLFMTTKQAGPPYEIGA